MESPPPGFDLIAFFSDPDTFKNITWWADSAQMGLFAQFVNHVRPPPSLSRDDIRKLSWQERLDLHGKVNRGCPHADIRFITRRVFDAMWRAVRDCSDFCDGGIKEETFAKALIACPSEWIPRLQRRLPELVAKWRQAREALEAQREAEAERKAEAQRRKAERKARKLQVQYEAELEAQRRKAERKEQKRQAKEQQRQAKEQQRQAKEQQRKAEAQRKAEHEAQLEAQRKVKTKDQKRRAKEQRRQADAHEREAPRRQDKTQRRQAKIKARAARSSLPPSAPPTASPATASRLASSSHGPQQEPSKKKRRLENGPRPRDGAPAQASAELVHRLATRVVTEFLAQSASPVMPDPRSDRSSRRPAVAQQGRSQVHAVPPAAPLRQERQPWSHWREANVADPNATDPNAADPNAADPHVTWPNSTPVEPRRRPKNGQDWQSNGHAIHAHSDALSSLCDPPQPANLHTPPSEPAAERIDMEREFSFDPPEHKSFPRRKAAASVSCPPSRPNSQPPQRACKGDAPSPSEIIEISDDSDHSEDSDDLDDEDSDCEDACILRSSSPNAEVCVSPPTPSVRSDSPAPPRPSDKCSRPVGKSRPTSGKTAPKLKRRHSTTSPYFTKPSRKRSRSVADSANAPDSRPKNVPFPPLSQTNWGLIQEQCWQDPFYLLVAASLLCQTPGAKVVDILFSLMDKFPTPQAVSSAEEGDIIDMIRPLGLHVVRAKRMIKLARAWVKRRPNSRQRYRILHYPNGGDGRDIGRKELVASESIDGRTGAWEVGGLPGVGPYAADCWRIFCRDVLLGKARDWNGGGSLDANFEPEWKRVVPLDKQLRSFLKWLWLKEGFDWNPLDGTRKRADAKYYERAFLFGGDTFPSGEDQPEEVDGQCDHAGGINCLRIDETPDAESMEPVGNCVEASLAAHLEAGPRLVQPESSPIHDSGGVSSSVRRSPVTSAGGAEATLQSTMAENAPQRRPKTPQISTRASPARPVLRTPRFTACNMGAPGSTWGVVRSGRRQGGLYSVTPEVVPSREPPEYVVPDGKKTLKVRFHCEFCGKPYKLLGPFRDHEESCGR